MSEFEYLNKVTIGQYLPLNSWVHQRNPGSKLISYFLLLCALTLTAHLYGLLIGFGAVIILLAVSRIPLRYALRGLIAPLPFLLVLAVLQIFISPAAMSAKPAMTFYGVGIYAAGIMAAIRLLIRFCILVILLTLSSATLSDLQMIHGIEVLMKPLNRISLRTESVVMTAQITFRFIPTIAINAEKIAKAQAARGAEWGIKKGNLFKRIRQIIPLLIPLFNNSLRQAETLADAMLARGFGSSKRRTSMVEYQMGFQDWVFLTGALILSAMIIFI